MGAFNRERKNKQRSMFGTPPRPRIGGSMTQVQCKNCKQTFQHEAALREHERTSLTCAITNGTPKRWPMITNVYERERDPSIQVDRKLARMEEQFHRALSACNEKIAALERALASYSFNVTRHRGLPEKPDYTQWVDEEDCLTTVDKHHGFPTRERIKF